MFKKLPYKRREASKEKEMLVKEQFNNKRRPLNLRQVQQFPKKRNDSSISKEIEEAKGSLRKRILSARSQSIGQKKRKTLKMIEDQYKIIKKKYEKEPSQEQKMRQPQFDQLCCNSRESLNPREQNTSRNRLIRVKSNDSFSKFITNKKVQQQNLKRIDSLKQQNTYLKEMHIHSLKRIEIYQQQKVNEKNKFQIEKTSYQRQMETLRGKIDRNKVDIGHLFSYQSFDPAKLVVKPIIEVEQNSSIMRSLYSTNKHSDNKKMELETQYGNSLNWSKKNPSETTAINSLQQVRDIIDLF